MKAFATTDLCSASVAAKLEEPASEALQGQTKLPQHILVVDDEAFIRRLNTQILNDSGFHVDAAEDGAVAWDMLQLKIYDLLITDINMPRVTGVELIQMVRAAGMIVRVIIVTGVLPEEECARYPWLQPVPRLLKPYTVVEFLGIVEKVLARPLPS